MWVLTWSWLQGDHEQQGATHHEPEHSGRSPGGHHKSCQLQSHGVLIAPRSSRPVLLPSGDDVRVRAGHPSRCPPLRPVPPASRPRGARRADDAVKGNEPRQRPCAAAGHGGSEAAGWGQSLPGPA